MPTQVMITHLGRAKTQAMIASAKATELLTIDASTVPDSINTDAFLLVCAEKAGRPIPAAVEALQKIADADSAAVRAAAPAEEAEPAPAPKATKATTDAAPKPTKPTK